MENKTVKLTALISVGVGAALLRCCAILMPQSAFAAVMTLLDPVVAVTAGLAFGILVGEGHGFWAPAAMLVSIIPGFFLAATSGMGALVTAATPAVVGICVGSAILRGTDRSTVVGITAFVCAAMFTASAVLAVLYAVKAAGTTPEALWNDCLAKINAVMTMFTESEDFAVLAKNYGMSAEDFLAAAKTYGGDILKITLLLMPAVIYVAYYFTAFFISFALKPILEVNKVPEFDETVTKRIAGNVVNIRITSRQPGYDSEFAVTPATKWAYLAAIAVLAFGAFFGAGIAVSVCAAEFAIALSPPFIILGYRFAYFLLKPRLGGAAIPIIVLLSLILAAYSLAVPTAVILGLASMRAYGGGFGGRADK